MNSEISIEAFQFQSLRKYMTPLYWKLRHLEAQADEEKASSLKCLIRAFFVRIRTYRGYSIEEMAEKLKVSTDTIEKFEIGELKSSKLEKAYCSQCHAWQELDYFERRVRDFQDPGLRKKRDDLGMVLLKSYGILLPDFSLANRNSEMGKVIQLQSRDQL